jgi:hypothetical protein
MIRLFRWESSGFSAFSTLISPLNQHNSSQKSLGIKLNILSHDNNDQFHWAACFQLVIKMKLHTSEKAALCGFLAIKGGNSEPHSAASWRE